MNTCHITGATGFIGSALCRELGRRGQPFVASGREQVETGLEGIHTVFHCAGVAHQSASESEHEQGNYQSVLAQAEAAHGAGVQQFVFLSSVKANEQGSAYGYWKWRAETELTQRYADSSMRVINLRPCLVYGPGMKGNLRSLQAAVRLGLPRPPTGGGRSLIGVDDLCAALLACLDAHYSGVLTLTVSDGQSYDLQRIHAAFRAGMGKSPGVVWVPGWIWTLACRVLDWVGRGENNYQKLFGSELYSNTELEEVLHWQPTQTLEDLVPQMLEFTA